MHVQLTQHAIDRASQRLLEHWLEECPTRTRGLASWVEAQVKKALRTAMPEKRRHDCLHLHTLGGVFVTQVVRGRDQTEYLKVVTFTPSAQPRPQRNGHREPRPCRLCGEAGCECATALSGV